MSRTSKLATLAMLAIVQLTAAIPHAVREGRHSKIPLPLKVRQYTSGEQPQQQPKRNETRGFEMTPLRKMSIGMFIASMAFALVALIQAAIVTSGEGTVHVLWQVFPYLVMTQAEVMVSITGLEFAYTQAPKKMKSTIMGFWLLSVSLGNKLTAVLTGFGDLSLTGFFWLFAGLMAAAAVLFTFRASFYKYRSYSQ